MNREHLGTCAIVQNEWIQHPWFMWSCPDCAIPQPSKTLLARGSDVQSMGAHMHLRHKDLLTLSFRLVPM